MTGGVAEFDRDGNCLNIEEKPKSSKSNYAIVGLYFYPNKVVGVVKHICVKTYAPMYISAPILNRMQRYEFQGSDRVPSSKSAVHKGNLHRI